MTNAGGAHRARIDAADQALSAYYRGVFGVSAEAADRDAKSAVSSLISSAFDLCQ